MSDIHSPSAGGIVGATGAGVAGIAVGAAAVADGVAARRQAEEADAADLLEAAASEGMKPAEYLRVYRKEEREARKDAQFVAQWVMNRMRSRVKLYAGDLVWAIVPILVSFPPVTDVSLVAGIWAIWTALRGLVRFDVWRQHRRARQRGLI